MGRRTLLLITSILIAAVGTALVAIYVRGADERAEADADLVEVVVATKRVNAGTPAGTAVDSLSFATDRVLKRERVTGAFTSLEQFVESTGDAVAVGPILPGQIIQAAMFGETAVVTGTGLEAGEMRIAVQLNDPNRSAGFLREGSLVAVFFTSGDGPAQQTNLLVPRVRVLNIGATVQAPAKSSSGQGATAGGDGATSAVEDTVPTTIVSVAVKQPDAQKLIFGQKAGELYLAILAPNAEGQPLPPTKLKDVTAP
jgi:pilus assembly protein CpaB